jgi:hypothetical protein
LYTVRWAHCKELIPKSRNKYSQKRNCADHSLNFHIHGSAKDLYIPMIDLPILQQENMWTDPGNIEIAHRHINVEIRKGIRKWDFRVGSSKRNYRAKTFAHGNKSKKLHFFLSLFCCYLFSHEFFYIFYGFKISIKISVFLISILYFATIFLLFLYEQLFCKF